MKTKGIYLFCIFATLLTVASSMAANTNDQAIDRVKNANFVYKGISANYMEISTAYAIARFTGVDFLGWETRPDPKNPVATLVTIKYKTTGVNSEVINAPDVSPGIRKKIRYAVPMLAITWRVNDLLDVKITPYNFYAEHAIKTYQGMVLVIHRLSK